MKTASIVTLTFAILGLAFAWWAADMARGAGNRVYDGHAQAEVGASSKDWSVTTRGLDEIRWGLKDLQISQGFIGLGLVVALPMAVASLALSLLVWKKSRTSHQSQRA